MTMLDNVDIEMLIKLSISASFGLILGWERDSKNKPIDFRAYIIIATATCALAILAEQLNQQYDNFDFAKLIAGILSGIGFLGAGAIIKKQDKTVIGSATGASIWAAAGMGLIIGFGFYEIGIILFIFIALILFLGGLFMEHVQGRKDQGSNG